MTAADWFIDDLPNQIALLLFGIGLGMLIAIYIWNGSEDE